MLPENIRQELADEVKTILVGNFSRRNVRNLYITLREFSIPGSFTEELGDFIAHNKRDNGLIFSYFKKYFTAIKNGKLVRHQVVAPKRVVNDLVKNLLPHFPEHRAYINRLIEQSMGIFMSILCDIQGSKFDLPDAIGSFDWFTSPGGYWGLSSTITFQDPYTRFSTPMFVSELSVTEFHSILQPPIDCFTKDGHVNMHSKW